MLIGRFGIVKLFKVCSFLMIINILNIAFWQKIIAINNFSKQKIVIIYSAGQKILGYCCVKVMQYFIAYPCSWHPTTWSKVI